MKTLAPHEKALADALAAGQRFSRVASKAVDELRTMPERVGLRHVMHNGIVEEFALARGVWVNALPGVRMMLIDEKRQCGGCDDCAAIGKVQGSCSVCTRVLCEADRVVRLSQHSHDCAEIVTIISGLLIEHIAKKTPVTLRRATDKIYYPAGQLHEPEIQGLMLICWTPPLATI